MKKSIKLNVSGLFPIIFTLGLAAYFMIIAIKYPLIGIEVREEKDEWVVKKVYENGWAFDQMIEEGDLVTLINGKKPEEHATVLIFGRVEMANTITTLNKEMETNRFTISYNHAEKQFITYLALPFLFYVITLVLSIFLYHKKKDDKSAIILMYFLLFLGLLYPSGVNSTQGNCIGRIANTIILLGSPLLFLHFIKVYLETLNLPFIGKRLLVILSVFGGLFVSVEVYSFKLTSLGPPIRTLKLLVFFFLLCCLFFYLGKFYFKHKGSEGHTIIKTLLFTLVTAFTPFLLLYVIPIIFFGNELISAEQAALFLLIIPVALVYLLLAENLFDIEFLLGRLRYYSFLALPFTVLVVLLVKFVVMPLSTATQIILFAIVLFTCTTFLLYMKEHVDYKSRRHLFSQKGNFEMSLHTFFQKAKHETKVTSLVNFLQSEIKDVLGVKEAFYSVLLTEDEGKSWVVEEQKNAHRSHIRHVEGVDGTTYQIGSLIEVVNGFGIVIGGDFHRRKVILFGRKNAKTNLNSQEKIWLETLAYFSSILLENFQVIEDLFDKIEGYKSGLGKTVYPPWLARLLFSLAEKERTNLSIDLHDSVLQDQLRLLREIEGITEKVANSPYENDLWELQERMLDTIHLVRETCNELRPPFLDEAGVVPSIQYFIDQTKLRSTFLLHAELDASILWLDKEVELALYRVVQELLNNAMKHSGASKVELVVGKNEHTLFLTYSDDGIGFDVATLEDSFKTMGLFGMQERVRSVGGIMHIESAEGQGMSAHVELKGEEVKRD